MVPSLLILCCLCFQAKTEATSNYCEVNVNHVLCETLENTADECSGNYYEIYHPDKEGREDILGALNLFRAEVAKGKEENDDKDELYGIKPAANMMKMKWDAELSSAALSIASNCLSSFDSCPECLSLERFNMTVVHLNIRNENSRQMALPWSECLRMLIASNWTEDRVVADPSAFHGGPIGPILPYDSFIMAESYLVGCSMAAHKGEAEDWLLRVVCALGPTKPVEGKPVYREGPPCSDCPLGSECSEVDGVLCACKDACYPFQYSDISRVKREESPTAAPPAEGQTEAASNATTVAGPQASNDTDLTESGNDTDDVIPAGEAASDVSENDMSESAGLASAAPDVAESVSEESSTSAGLSLGASLPLHLIYVAFVVMTWKF